MIQRKQTLFLLTAAILMILTLFTPFISSGDIHFTAFDFSATGVEQKIQVFPIGIYIIIIAVLQLFTIMLFKNRKIQMRFTMFDLILSLGFYGILYFYHTMISNIVELDFKNYSFALIAPLLAAIFDFMAYGGIKKDEKIIRDSERLR